MKIENCKLKIAKRDAFTLIEIMIAIAIVGIMAAVVLVSMSSYGKKARSSKALAQLSSAIPSMVSCWGNGGIVRKPTADGIICRIGGSDVDSYGKWPSATDYSYSSSSALCSGIFCLKKDSWFVSMANGSDDKRVCCNSTIPGCASSIKASGDTCDASGWKD